MAKFNTVSQSSGRVVKQNNEGTNVVEMKALETLFSKTMGSFFGESGYYESKNVNSSFKELKDLVYQVREEDKEYVLKIALLARNRNMISYPLQILTACFNDSRFNGENFKDLSTGTGLISTYSDRIVRRAKDVNEVLASHFANYGNGSTLPKQMRKALKRKLESFDTFQLSMGRDTNSSTKLSDSIKVLHPKPRNSTMESFYWDILEGKVTLGNGKKQVRSVLSESKGKTKEEVKTDLKSTVFTSTVLTLLKNLRVFYERGLFDDQEVVEYIVKTFSDKGQIERSKVLPFRFYTAHTSLENFSGVGVSRVRESVSDALDLSINNVPELSGYNAILLDVSMSMYYGVSDNSTVKFSDIVSLLGAVAYKRGFSDLFIFSSSVEQVTVSRKSTILDIMRAIRRSSTFGGGTDLQRALNYVSSRSENSGVTYTNLILMTDSDCYGYFTTSLGGRVSPTHRHVQKLISDNRIRNLWLNNVQGNDFSVVNLDHPNMHLVTSFSESFLEMIRIYGDLGGGKDVRQLIDEMLETKK